MSSYGWLVELPALTCSMWNELYARMLHIGCEAGLHHWGLACSCSLHVDYITSCGFRTFSAVYDTATSTVKAQPHLMLDYSVLHTRQWEQNMTHLYVFCLGMQSSAD